MCTPNTACEYSFEFFLVLCVNAYKLFWMFKWARHKNAQMISFRGDAQQWRIFRMASASQMKWKSCAIALVINRNTAWFSKSQCFDRNTDGVNLWMNEWKFCHKYVVTYPRAFWGIGVYGNPWPLLVGICRIPAYHVDYTTGCMGSSRLV